MQRCGNQLDKLDLSLVDLHGALETHRAISDAFEKDVQGIVSGERDEIIIAQGNLTTGILSAVEQTRSEAFQSLNAISDQLEILQQDHRHGNQNLRNLLAEQQISTLACQIHVENIENIEKILHGMRQETLQRQCLQVTNWLVLLQTAGSVIGALTGVASLKAQYKLNGNDVGMNMVQSA